MINKTPVLSTRADLTEEFEEIMDLFSDKKNEKNVLRAQHNINNTLDAFSKQIEELSLIKNKMKAKVQSVKKDLAKIKNETITEKENVIKLNKQII